MKAFQIRENARTALAGKWGKGALITLAYMAIFFAIGLVSGMFGEEALVASLFDIATYVIQVPIIFGLACAYVKLKKK